MFVAAGDTDAGLGEGNSVLVETLQSSDSLCRERWIFYIIPTVQHNTHLGHCEQSFSPIFTELSTRFAQNDQPVTHRGVDDKLHDLFPT